MRTVAITVATIVGGLAACETTPLPPLPEPIPAAAEAGYRSAAPVIAALEAFRRHQGHYPAKLSQLKPHYIRHVRQIAYSTSSEDQTNAFQYYPEGDKYTLDFTYYTEHTSEMHGYDSKKKEWVHVTIH